ncbi:MAG: tetratricopeptide repeat protein [Deltaproteobacteria bacterium]|nr:tetratricopeptide repeat protein [Deltaproteobacteria bacterium]
MVSVLLLTSLLAVAAPPAPGRVEYQKATKLYAQERYEQALPWFERAYERSGHRPSTTFGLAQCERAVGRLDAAEAHLQEFLADAEGEDRRRGEKLLAQVRAERVKAAAALVARAPPPAPGAAPRDVAAPRPPPPPQASLPPVTEAQTEPESDSIWSGPLPWIVAGAVVVAGAVTAGLLLSGGDPEAYGGTTGQVFRP